MPGAWSDKDERQFEKIRDSVKQQGKNTATAKEIAARTVNKQRRSEGRTPNTRSQGTGNPNLPLEDRTRRELYNRAKQLDIAQRSSMTKSELIDAIRSSQ
jgi:plasmid stabilization system protein ParE